VRHASKHDVLVQFMLLRVRARLEAWARNTDRAESFARQAVDLSERTDDLSARADTVVALAEVLARADRPSDAALAIRAADALYERKENVAGRSRAHLLIEQLQPA
jgi:hypothetical protein